MPSPFLSPLPALRPIPGDSLPALVSVGSIRVAADESQPLVPLALPIGGAVEGSAGLCVRVNSYTQPVADLQQAVAMRLACGVEESLLRIHAIDLLGVGACYPYLGPLPDAIFSRKDLITESRGLSVLLGQLLEEAKSRNLEKLAHRFRTLREFNAATGSTDPLHLVLVSAFPAKWTEEQLTLLGQLIILAPRVGIWLVIHHDPAQRTAGLHDRAELAAEAVAPLAQLHWDGTAKRWSLTNSPVPAALHPAWTLSPDGLAVALPAAHLDTVLTRMRQAAEEPESRHGGIRVPIGTRAGQPFHFELGHHSGVHHALIGGTIGSGKSVLLHNIVLGLMEHYTPQEVQLVLMDLKEGTEFVHYRQHPMTRHFLHGTDAGQALAALQDVLATLTERGQLFREAGVNDIARYNEQQPASPLPRIVIIVDEFQKLFAGSYKEVGAVNSLLEDLAKRGRSFGVHLIMGSQSLAQSAFDKTTRNVFGLRILLKISLSECALFFDDITNDAPSRYTKPGLAIYNARHGMKDSNKEIRVTYLTLEEIKQRVAKAGTPPRVPNQW